MIKYILLFLYILCPCLRAVADEVKSYPIALKLKYMDSYHYIDLQSVITNTTDKKLCLLADYFPYYTDHRRSFIRNFSLRSLETGFHIVSPNKYIPKFQTKEIKFLKVGQSLYSEQPIIRLTATYHNTDINKQKLQLKYKVHGLYCDQKEDVSADRFFELRQTGKDPKPTEGVTFYGTVTFIPNQLKKRASSQVNNSKGKN